MTGCLFVTLALCGILVPTLSSAINLPIQIDGDYGDWTGGAEIGADAEGDDGPSGIDFTSLKVANDGDGVYFQFDTTTEVQGDEQQEIFFAIDSDRDSDTGSSVQGIGAELVWGLGDRSGYVQPGGSQSSTTHAALGLVFSPTVSDTKFEFALSRSATPEGLDLFPGVSFDIVFWDDDGGDVIGPFTYTFEEGNVPVVSRSVGRDDPGHFRLCAYNVQGDGLFDTDNARENAIDRLLDSIDPDVFIFCEVWNHNGSQVATRLEEFLPSQNGESWTAIKVDGGNAVATRLPIVDFWDILPGSRLTAVLVDSDAVYGSDVLVIANHWSCCTADENRQRQADALIDFLRDARSPGGRIDLPADTPIIAGGDFNLVGLRRQLETLLTGDIADNGTWGPDSPPDWDGSDFDVVDGRHPDARFVYTWRQDGSSFYPGKLDYIVYTGSVFTNEKSLTVETRTMSSSSLLDAGLLASDTVVASDHAPVVADFSFGDTSGTGEMIPQIDSSRLLAARPSPFRDSTELSFELARDERISLHLFDTQGRTVRNLLENEAHDAGRHQIDWDGLDDAGRRVPAGVYWYRMSAGNTSDTRSLARIP